MTREAAQLILTTFMDAMARSADVRSMARGRPVEGIAACVRKLVDAERQHAIHTLAAADRALASLE
jgi:hypothetical protein